MLLPFFIWLAFESRIREPVLIAVCPLRPALMALNCGSVDEPVTLGPFRGTSVILIVPYVLETLGLRIHKMRDETRVPGYKNYGHGLNE